jgi:hypothetical protein
MIFYLQLFMVKQAEKDAHRSRYDLHDWYPRIVEEKDAGNNVGIEEEAQNASNLVE